MATTKKVQARGHQRRKKNIQRKNETGLFRALKRVDVQGYKSVAKNYPQKPSVPQTVNFRVKAEFTRDKMTRTHMH